MLWRLFLLLLVGLAVYAAITRSRMLTRTFWVLAALAVLYTILKLTGVVEATCFHQVEFAGILRGSTHADAAGKLIDYLVSDEFQRALPLALFVYPVRTGTALPPEFEKWAVRPASPLALDPAAIEQHGKAWVDTWTDLVVR